MCCSPVDRCESTGSSWTRQRPWRGWGWWGHRGGRLHLPGRSVHRGPRSPALEFLSYRRTAMRWRMNWTGRNRYAYPAIRSVGADGNIFFKAVFGRYV
uniref:Uncharacterized protein n=1 Tax=Oryza rufipogon TaxID=4529 RepID=A0A0E0P088_ORYRU